MTKRIGVFDIEADALGVRNVQNIWCVVVQLLDGTVKEFGPDEIAEAVDYLNELDAVVGHNIISYDIPVLKKFYPHFQPKAAHDTSIWSRMTFPDKYTNPVRGHSLKDWGRYLGNKKIDFHERHRFSPEMMKYCKQDVALNVEVFRFLVKRVKHFGIAPKLETKCAEMIAWQCRNGVGFRTDRALVLKRRLERIKDGIVTQLQEVFPPNVTEMKTPEYWTDDETGTQYPTKGAGIKAGVKPGKLTRGPNHKKYDHFNPGSRDQIAERLIEKYSWKPKKTTPTGKPMIDESVLDGMSYPEAKLLNRYLLVDKRLSQLQSWLDAEEDGVIYGSVITIGCVTSRMSHSNPNLGQVPRVSVLLGRVFRSLFVPITEGWQMVGADLSGLELRMLANRLWRWDNGAFSKIVLEGDVHTHVLGIINQFFDESDQKKRDDAKTTIYAIIYGAKVKKIASILSCSRQKAQRILDALKSQIVGLGKLLDWIELQVKKHGYIVALDGRRVPFRSAHSALNTMLQCDGAIVGKLAWVIWYDWLLKEKPPVRPMLNVHDEQQAEAAPSHAHECGKRLVQAMKKAGQMLKIKIPIDGGYEIGRSWKDTH